MDQLRYFPPPGTHIPLPFKTLQKSVEMVMQGLLDHHTSDMVVLRFASMPHGELFVVAFGTIRMLVWCAGNLDTLHLVNLHSLN